MPCGNGTHGETELEANRYKQFKSTMACGGEGRAGVAGSEARPISTDRSSVSWLWSEARRGQAESCLRRVHIPEENHHDVVCGHVA